MLALCGFTAMLALGSAGAMPPPEGFPFPDFIARAGLKCPEQTIAIPATTAPTPALAPATAEPLPVIPTSPTPAAPTAKKPAPAPDPFVRKAKEVQDAVTRRCAKHVKRGHTVKVSVHHEINTMAATVAARPENSTGSEAENCVISTVTAAKRWPTGLAKSRVYHYRVKGSR